MVMVFIFIKATENTCACFEVSRRVDITIGCLRVFTGKQGDLISATHDLYTFYEVLLVWGTRCCDVALHQDVYGSKPY